MEKVIILDKVRHNGENRILVKFSYDDQLIEVMRKLNDSRWSKTHKCWHVPNNPTTLKDILRSFKGIASINSDGIFKKKTIVKGNTTKAHKVVLSQKAQKSLEAYKEYLEYKRYRPNTIRVYVSMLQAFLYYHQGKEISNLTRDDILAFNRDYILKNNFSFNYQNQLISAVKLYYERLEDHKIDLENLERPKGSKSLPVVLSVQEVKRIINSINNIKHKSIICLIYSSGLRISEVINMKLRDIDTERNLIHIRKAKGEKDRVVNISSNLKRLLEIYIKEYEPKDYLFNGQDGGTYSTGSIRNIFKRAKQKAGIKKYVRVHSLRHSYATHMLEKGVDIRYIQEMLGHKDPKTTMIYTHVSERKINIFTTPLDEFEI